MKKSKVKMGQIDFVLFATIMLLVAIGVVMVYSAVHIIRLSNLMIQNIYLKKQVTVGMYWLYFYGYSY